MNLILPAATILHHILIDHRSFAEASREYFSLHGCKREDRKIIQNLVVRSLQNDLVFDKIISDSFPSIEIKEKMLLDVALANTVFVKAISREETFEQVRSSLPSDSKLSRRMIEKLCQQDLTADRLIPSYIDPRSLDYLQLKYNLPRWLILMWTKHYGKAVAMRIFSQVRKRPIYTLRVNRKKTDRKRFLAQYGGKDFIAGIGETTIDYRGKKNPSRLDAVRRGELIPVAEGTNHVWNKLPWKANSDILVVSSKHRWSVLALLERLESWSEMLYIVPDYPHAVDARKALSAFAFPEIKTIDVPISLLVTEVAHPYQFVVVMPPSSEFQAISATPDFFVHFHNDQLDGIIQSQSAYLNECASYVEVGGILVYLVETANNKEGALQIKNFLSDHPEYHLLEENQMLPFDKRRSSCYFAFLRRVGEGS